MDARDIAHLVVPLFRARSVLVQRLLLLRVLLCQLLLKLFQQYRLLRLQSLKLLLVLLVELSQLLFLLLVELSQLMLTLCLETCDLRRELLSRRLELLQLRVVSVAQLIDVRRRLHALRAPQTMLGLHTSSRHETRRTRRCAHLPALGVTCDIKAERIDHVDLDFARLFAALDRSRAADCRRLAQPRGSRAHVHGAVPSARTAVLVLLVPVRERDDEWRDRLEIIGYRLCSHD